MKNTKDLANDIILSAINNSPLMTILVDTEVKLVATNEVFKKVFSVKDGIEYGELFGNIAGCIHVVTKAAKCGKTGACKECFIRNSVEDTFMINRNIFKRKGEFVFRKNESTITVALEITTALIKHDNCRGVLVYINDITNHEELLKTISETKKRLELVVEANNSGIWEHNIVNGENYYSSRCKEILGYTDSELTDSEINWQNFLHPDERVEIIKSYNEYVEGNRDKYELTYRMKHKNGEFKWVHSKGFTIRNTLGRVIRMVGSTNDISDYITMSKTIREKDNKILLLMDSTAEGIIGMDSNGLCTYVNKSCLGILGYSENELLGKNIHEIIHHSYPDGRPMKETYCRMNRAYKKGIEIIEEEEVLWRKNGTTVPVVYHAFPHIIDGIIVGAVVTFQDVSIKKAKEEEIAIYLNELEELNNAKNKYISIIAHDLRSPFTSLLGFADILHNCYYELSEDEKREYVGYLYDTTKRTFSLLENLLMWAYSQTGRMDAKPNSFNIHSILLKNKELFDQIASKKGITISYKFEEDLFVFADENMINTVIRNLLSNAIKYSFNNGEIILDVSPKGNYACVFVRDNGVGIQNRVIERILNNSVVDSTPGTQNEKGTGIGLQLCKDFIEKNGGILQILSEVKKGTTFCFTVPLHAKPDN